MRSKYLLTILLGILLLGGGLERASAEEGEAKRNFIVSGGGGIFEPFNGKTGFSGLVQAMIAISPRVRLGGELEFRDYETELFNVKDVGIQTFHFRGLGMFFFRPEGISPYIGGGFGFSVNSIDDNKIERNRPGIMVKSDIGLGFGVMGLVGLDVPIGTRVALFAEGRANADFQVTETEGPGSSNTEIENIGGLSGLGGIRFRF